LSCFRILYFDFPHLLDLLPFALKRAFEERVLGQYKIGVIGPIASGKSHMCRRLAERSKLLGIPCLHVSYDQLTRELYAEQSPEAEQVRERIVELLGSDTRDADGSMNRKIMAARLFAPDCPEETRRTIEKAITPHVLRMEQELLTGFRGLVLIECATLLEMGLMGRVNNHVIVVESLEHDAMLLARQIDRKFAADVARHQSTADELANLANRLIRNDRGGFVLRYANRMSETRDDLNRDTTELMRQVLSVLPSILDETEALC